MIAAAIVCAAVVSQGAAILWSVENIYKDDGATMWETNPGLYLAKVTDSGNQIIEPVGSFDYDDGWNAIEGKYTLTEGKDKNGDMFVVADIDGNAITDLDGDPLVYTLSGFEDASSKIGALSWDGAMTAAVPEPTSGLLLLLGVAGLALRRRRA